MKILFVCPILDIRYEWLMGFIQIQKQLARHEVEYYIPYRKPLIFADNAMGRKLLEGNFDYALRMDDDVWDVPADALERLIEADKEFVSCVMYANGFPYQRCAALKRDKSVSLVDIANNGKGGLREATGSGVVPVDLSAFPFTLIKPSVFRKIPQPWFEYSGGGTFTDSYFCQKMLDYGIQPYAHMDLQVTHRGVTHWNRNYSFLADAEFGIATGRIDENHKDFNSYLRIREDMVKRYAGKEIENRLVLCR